MTPSPFEQWIEIAGWEGMYAVSSHGRVMSLERKVCGTRFDKSKVCRVIPEVVMAQMDHRAGYKCVWFRRTGAHKKQFVHRLVALAFLPNPEGKPIVNHIDGNKENNTLANLEWATCSENTNHYYKNRKVPVPAAVEDEPIKPEDIPF